ncbi:MAG: hypothetical protein HUU37_04870 [Bdellovibrionales bacterium]|nr:hypothetical protein [Bdellovibrionales bacterium]
MKRVVSLVILWVLAGGLAGCEKKSERDASDTDAAVAEGTRSTDAEPDEMQDKEEQKKEIPDESPER